MYIKYDCKTMTICYKNMAFEIANQKSRGILPL